MEAKLNDAKASVASVEEVSKKATEEAEKEKVKAKDEVAKADSDK